MAVLGYFASLFVINCFVIDTITENKTSEFRILNLL